MSGVIFPAIAGLVCGIISGWGIGGGTILMIFMTNIAGLPQNIAQGINLVYFLPLSAAALISHFKNNLVNKRAVVPAVIFGVIASSAASFLATALDPSILKKIFGIFLLVIGIRELFRK